MTDQALSIQAGEVLPIEHRQIAALLFVEAPKASADAPVEIRVGLHDGRAFSFTVYTPAALLRLLSDSGQNSLVDVGMMVLRVITVEAVIEALDKMLVLNIERFGVAI